MSPNGNEKKRSNTSANWNRILSRLESDIGYCFTDRGLLRRALTSRRCASRNFDMLDNHRLKFFGDAVLRFAISNRLMELHPKSREGSLSRMRASLTGPDTLARLSGDIGLGDCLSLSRAEEKTGGRTKTSVLAEALQALVAAVYLDGGITAAERLVYRMFAPLLTEYMRGDTQDYKSMLLELAQSLRCRPPLYIVNDVTGPDHDLHFTVTVIVGDECFGTGTGRTRKEAEQHAAREGLMLLEEDARRRKHGSQHPEEHQPV